MARTRRQNGPLGCTSRQKPACRVQQQYSRYPHLACGRRELLDELEAEHPLVPLGAYVHVSHSQTDVERSLEAWHERMLPDRHDRIAATSATREECATTRP